MRPRIVCHLIDYGGSTGGSFIPSLAALGSALQARGIDMVVVATRFSGSTWQSELAKAGVEVRFVDDSAHAKAVVQGLRPDIVHSHFLRYDATAAACGARSVFWHVHSARDSYSRLARARSLVKYRVVGARVEAFVAVSHAIGDECVAFSAPRKRVRVVANGVDCEHFRPPEREERTTCRKRLGIAPNERVALFFDRAPSKGGALVREANVGSKSYRLLVAGREQRVEDTRELYWAADALVFASVPTSQCPLAEGLPYVLLEALACGLPIAAAEIPVVREVCHDLKDVVPFTPGDAAGLRRALENALTGKVNGSGRRRVTERFSLPAWTTAIMDLYEQRRQEFRQNGAPSPWLRKTQRSLDR